MKSLYNFGKNTICNCPRNTDIYSIVKLGDIPEMMTVKVERRGAFIVAYPRNVYLKITV